MTTQVCIILLRCRDEEGDINISILRFPAPVTESTPDRSYALSSTWLCDQWSVYLDGITALQHVAYQQWRSLLGQGGLVGGHEAHTQAFPPPLVDHIRSCELPTASFKFPEALHRGGGSSQER